MRIEWSIEEEDVVRTQSFIKSQSRNRFVKRRIEKNVDAKYVPRFNRERFWKVMVECLLSTRQRAGPNSALTRFCSMRPFPLSLEECTSHSVSLSSFVEDRITRFGGLRRAKTIGKQVDENFRWLDQSGWIEIERIADELIKCRKRDPLTEDIVIERKAANLVAKNLSGFGTKQPRNLWQTLGWFRFEIPLDSRITKWLNENGFPVRLSATALADKNYYEFVMTGIQQLCETCDVLPCVFDAAVFSSYDQEWTEDKLVW